MLGTDQAWLDAIWSFLVAAPSDGYYGDSIKLLAMFVMSGHWAAP